MSVYYAFFSFFIYGFFGWCAEVTFSAVRQKKFINRGFLYGPICPIYGVGIVCIVQILGEYSEHTLLLYVMSVLITTVLEWMAGFLLEKIFHHKWWDYSHLPGNIQGYVCVPFSLAWGIACVIVVRYIHPFVYKLISWIPETVGTMFVIVSTITIFADICVTVNGIFKMNLKLEKMQRTANELQKLSVHLGENISRNILEGMEKQENAKLKAEEMKEKYQELVESACHENRRLIKAFPKIDSLRYGEQLKELKEVFRKRKTRKN